MKLLETTVKMPKLRAKKASNTIPAAKARGIFLFRLSTSGVSSNCNKSEIKIINANCGKNQKVESSAVKVMPSKMEVR